MSSTINASTASGGGVITSADASGILQLQTAGTTAVTIDASQNVGIGTSSPTAYGSTTLSLNSASASAYLDLWYAGSRKGYHYSTSSTYNISTTSATSLVLETVGSERMRIDSSGNVGIGAGTSSQLLSINSSASGVGIGFGGITNNYGNIWNEYGTGDTLIASNLMGSTTSTNAVSSFTGTVGSAAIRLGYAGAMKFYTNASTAVTRGVTYALTPAMTLDTSGNLLVGTTSTVAAGKVGIQAGVALSLRGSAANNCAGVEFVRADTNVKAFGIESNANDFYIINANFSKYALLTTQNFTAWTFASDRRIKNNIEDLSYGLNEVLKIKPRQFNYITDNQHDIGFIAQELQTVIPEAVSGSEIIYDEADTPQERASKTMGVSKDALIPVLVKAIQELKAIIDTQNARIEALEALV